MVIDLTLNSQWAPHVSPVRVSHEVSVILENINSLVPEKCGNNFKSTIIEHILWIKFMSCSCETVLRWMPQNSEISQHRFSQWLGAIRQQAIIYVNVDPYLCRHIASLDHKELTEYFREWPCFITKFPLCLCRLNEELQPMYDEHVQRGVSGVEVVSEGEGYATNFCTQVIIILLQLGQNAAFGGRNFRFRFKFHWNQFTRFQLAISEDCFR